MSAIWLLDLVNFTALSPTKQFFNRLLTGIVDWHEPGAKGDGRHRCDTPFSTQRLPGTIAHCPLSAGDESLRFGGSSHRFLAKSSPIPLIPR